MAVMVSGVEKKLGLSLSGGGFRAAAFHLGVFRQLHRRRLLDKFDLVSCVSGGSIAGAVLALHWPDTGKAMDLIDAYLRTKSIAVASAVGGLLDPFESRIDKLAESYDRDLFKGATLGSLKAGPRLYLNATNLATGNLFFFATGGEKATEMGDYELGAASADTFPLCRAVAASSAFPPVFPPLRLNPQVYPPAAPLDYVTLCDGGVYDNLGINPALRTVRNPLDYLIVSDGALPFAIAPEPTESGVIVLKEAINIMMEQIRGLEFDRIQHRHLANKGPKPLWFSLDSVEGEQQAGDAQFAAAVGTNLKRLSEHEMTVLTRHGSALVQSRLQTYAPELP